MIIVIKKCIKYLHCLSQINCNSKIIVPKCEILYLLSLTKYINDVAVFLFSLMILSGRLQRERLECEVERAKHDRAVSL